ncbi:MAG TPA: hypothetical protein VG248_09150 [Caulobacteraceae bacterium]|jgi:hypothetical protein|nr:hypothetical protein [Caulobacteraceae bacterium]
MRRALVSVLVPALLLACPASAGSGAGAPLAAFKDHNPVVLIFAPSPEDGRLLRQAGEMARLEAKPFYQSVIVATVSGTIVMGVTDTAAALRARFRAPPNAFRIILISRGGAVAMDQAQVAAEPALEQAVNRSARPR